MVVCSQCQGSGQVNGRTESKDKSTSKVHGGHGATGISGSSTGTCQQCLGKGYHS